MWSGFIRCCRNMKENNYTDITHNCGFFSYLLTKYISDTVFLTIQYTASHTILYIVETYTIEVQFSVSKWKGKPRHR